MKNFSNLYRALDQTNKTNAKIGILSSYFEHAEASDAVWALYFLSGKRPRRAVDSRKLSVWASEETGTPLWLFEECYDRVGDLAETVALLLPEQPEGMVPSLSQWMEDVILPLQSLSEEEQKQSVLSAWRILDQHQRFVFNKLITGGFRVGVSQKLVLRALARVSGLTKEVLAHRMMGEWQPQEDFYNSLLRPEDGERNLSHPYPFFLAYPLDDPKDLGEITEFQAEWKWDGIRAQVIRRQEQVFIWSRGEELVTEQYPEIEHAMQQLPYDLVLDGELLPWKQQRVLPFSEMQRRIGRKSPGKKILEEIPVILMVYDLLEKDGEDLRELPLHQRRSLLENLFSEQKEEAIRLSPIVRSKSWQQLKHIREDSRALGVEGLMLKRTDSPYRVGRVRGDWWKWKIDPFTVDAVLIYAQMGSGKRASLYTDYTFGIWNEEGELVPFAKAYSGLSDGEIREVDAFIRRNIIEKFGPVRRVKPELVFELAFEGIQRSKRHKSGIALRFPRMNRWRKDKKPEQADQLSAILEYLPMTEEQGAG